MARDGSIYCSALVTLKAEVIYLDTVGTLICRCPATSGPDDIQIL